MKQKTYEVMEWNYIICMNTTTNNMSFVCMLINLLTSNGTKKTLLSSAFVSHLFIYWFKPLGYSTLLVFSYQYYSKSGFVNYFD